MRYQIISTKDVDTHRRLEYWSEIVCGTYVQLECEAPQRSATIEGSIATAKLPMLDLTKVAASAQSVHRTASKISKESEDYFLVSIQTAGQCLLTQDGRQALLVPGDFALYDSTRPYTLRFDSQFKQYVLVFPGALLRSEIPNAIQLTANAVSGDTGAGHLLVNMVQTLERHINTLAPESATAVASSVRQILLAGLSTLPAAKCAQNSTMHAYHLERIKAHVLKRLRDPSLSVASIAAELKISPSSIYRTWNGQGYPLSDWIWAQRLDAARRDLANPGLNNQNISQIAFSWGFNDAAHFSRAFRLRYGCTPRDIRLQHLNSVETSEGMPS